LNLIGRQDWLGQRAVKLVIANAVLALIGEPYERVNLLHLKDRKMRLSKPAESSSLRRIFAEEGEGTVEFERCPGKPSIPKVGY
jgi:hypothetical protein